MKATNHRHIWIWRLPLAGLLLALGPAAALGSSVNCPSIKDTKKRLEDDRKGYTPPAAPVTGSAKDQGDAHRGAVDDANVATPPLADCVAKMGDFEGRAKKLAENAKKDCSEEEKGIKKMEREYRQDRMKCEKAIQTLKQQSGKNDDRKGNLGSENKGADGGKGDGKGDGKGEEKGGGGGGAPPMPQMPQKKEDEKKDDSAQREAERKAKIAECKFQVRSNLEQKKMSCRNTFYIDPNFPAPAGQQKRQEDCIQTAIFASQSEEYACESRYPPMTGSKGSTISGSR